MNPTYQQSGAIPFRIKDGKLSVLLITSRRKKRWIIPKGHVEYDMHAAESAQKEAFEEAGVLGKIYKDEVGDYSYTKWEMNFRVKLYLLEVLQELPDWPEKPFRQRKWLSPKKAAQLVDLPQLKSIFRKLSNFVLK